MIAAIHFLGSKSVHFLIWLIFFGTFTNDGIVQERSLEEERLMAIIISRRYICLVYLC